MTSEQKKTAGIAVASLVLGILGLALLGPLGSIPAVICGHLALSQFKKNPDGPGGNGLALAGLILGYIQIGLMAVLLPLLAAILLPAISRASTQAGMIATVANGANIYRSFMAGQMNNAAVAESNASLWPQKGEYRTSTEFFIHLVESGMMTVTYDFFAAPGIPPAKTMDPNGFKAENNAWRLVLGLDKAPEGTPFLFSKNYDPGQLNRGDEPIVLNNEAPFGQKGVVVVLKGGSAFCLKGNQLKNSFFNPAEASSGEGMAIIGP